MNVDALKNEAVLVTSVVTAGLGLLVTLGAGLSTDQAGAITAALTAVFGVIAAALTRPVAPTAFTALVGAGADLLTAFHFHLSAGAVGSVNALVLALLALVLRGHVTPTARPLAQ